MWGAAVAQWGSSSSRAALCLPAPLAARCPSPALLGPATPTWPAGQPTSQPEQRLPHMPAVLCCAVLCLLCRAWTCLCLMTTPAGSRRCRVSDNAQCAVLPSSVQCCLVLPSAAWCLQWTGGAWGASADSQLIASLCPCCPACPPHRRCRPADVSAPLHCLLILVLPARLQCTAQTGWAPRGTRSARSWQRQRRGWQRSGSTPTSAARCREPVPLLARSRRRAELSAEERTICVPLAVRASLERQAKRLNALNGD